MQLGMVLERYPDDVVREIASPITGIQTKRETPPTLAFVKGACDEQCARMERTKRWSGLRPAPREPPPTNNRANVWVPDYAPQYAKMMERTAKADPLDYRFEERPGVWVPYSWMIEDERPTTKGPKPPLFTVEDLERIYKRHVAGAEAAE